MSEGGSATDASAARTATLRMPPGLPTVLIALALVGLALFAIQILEILAVLFLGVVAGLTLAPVTDYFARWRIPRGLSVLVVYALVAGALGLALWYAIPEVSGEVRALMDRSDEFEARYEQAARRYNLPPLDEVGDYLRSFAGQLAPNIGRQAFVLASALLHLGAVLVVALFFTTTRDAARTLCLSLLPAGRRDRVDEVGQVIAHRLRRYVLGQLISMSIIGVVTYIGLLIIGAPFPLLLAVLAFFLELIPVLGPWVAAVPAVGLALTEGAGTAVAVAVFYLVLQQIESHLVLPLIQRQQTEMPALLILAAVLIGGAAMGILGALVALPLAVVLHTVVVDVVIPWRQQQVAPANATGPAVDAGDSERSSDDELVRPT